MANQTQSALMPELILELVLVHLGTLELLPSLVSKFSEDVLVRTSICSITRLTVG